MGPVHAWSDGYDKGMLHVLQPRWRVDCGGFRCRGAVTMGYGRTLTGRIRLGAEAVFPSSGQGVLLRHSGDLHTLI